MDAQLKQKWIEALRSGKYDQTKGALRTEAGFCCLGVLCEVTGAGLWDRDGEDFVYSCSDGLSGSGYMPSVVAVISGLSSKQEGELASRNDGGSAFSEVADYIEANIPADPTPAPGA